MPRTASPSGPLSIDQRVLAAGAAQRLEHVADRAPVTSASAITSTCSQRGHDVGDGKLVAPQAAVDGDPHRALAEEVGRGDHAEHLLVVVDRGAAARRA